MATARATARNALRKTTVTASAPSWTSAAAADTDAIEIQNMYFSGGKVQVEKDKAPLIGVTKGALRAVAHSYLSTPKRHAKGLVVRSSPGSVQLDCEDDHRYQFSGQFGCLADQEKDCCRGWQIVSLRGARKSPKRKNLMGRAD